MLRYLPFLFIALATPVSAATVTLSNGSSCAYSAVTVNAAGNLVVTCAGAVIPVVPGGGPPPPPPPVITDPCADLPPSTRVYCRSPSTPTAPGPGPGTGSPVTPSATVLEAPGGHPIRDAGGDKLYNMPGVRAGETIEVSVQGGFSNETTGVIVTIRDQAGTIVKNSRNGLGPELLFGGYGIIVFVAPTSGNYTVEMHGGGSLTTLNHWRR
jgi:hypothetical protein